MLYFKRFTIKGGEMLDITKAILRLFGYYMAHYPLISGLVIIGLFIYISYKRTTRKYSEQREANKCESPIETLLFEALLKEGYQVYTQVPCGAYRIDLAIYSGRRKIAIEADGKAYHSSPEQVEHDKRKDWYLERNGWRVIRFSGSEIYRNSHKCVAEVEILMKNNRFY